MKYKLYYCKSRKKTGDPIVVEYPDGSVSFHDQFCTEGKFRLSMKFNNAKGRAKKSGATTLLEIEEL